MVDSIILTVTDDELFLQVLRWQLQDQKGEAVRMALAGTINEACSFLTVNHPRLIVVHWGRGGRYEELNRLLGTTSVQAQRVPVLVIADWYRVDQAARLRDMGVTDYLSRSHHQNQLARALDAYLRDGTSPGRGATVPLDQPARPTRARSRQRLAMAT